LSLRAIVAALLIAQTLIVPLTGKRTRQIETASLFHTLFHDFFPEDDATTYVQTGDIPAMWLRDSAAQTIPYIRFQSDYPILRERFGGVIEREMRAINKDVYANAFQDTYHVWERKWEVDSLAWPVLLLDVYLRQTGDVSVLSPEVHAALRQIVFTYGCEQHHRRCNRYTYPYHVYSDDRYNDDTGMIWCAFRPSDDPVQYRFNIPQEMIAVVALYDIAAIASESYHDKTLASDALATAASVYTGIQRYGLFFDARRRVWMYAYETDGNGRYNLMDDANLPNLTTAPYIDWSSAFDPTYLATRAFTLSMDDPWFFSGRYAEGLGSPHTPYGFVWPLGIIGRALTSTDLGEVMTAVTTLAETDSEAGLLHESFYPDGYWEFTRQEFGWANALYAELLFRSLAGYPSPGFIRGGTAMPFQRPTRTPQLVPLVVQLDNTANLVRTLGQLLREGRNAAIAAP
jgi:uncharacterized protein